MAKTTSLDVLEAFEVKVDEAGRAREHRIARAVHIERTLGGALHSTSICGA